MSKIVAIREAHPSGEYNTRNKHSIGDTVHVPEWIKEGFDTGEDVEERVTGERVLFEDEGHRITCTCRASYGDQSTKFYIHYPVGNLQKIVYAEV